MSPSARFTNPALKNPVRAEGKVHVKGPSGSMDSSALLRSLSSSGIRGSQATTNGIPKFLVSSRENTLANGFSFTCEKPERSFSNVYKTEQDFD